MEKVMAYFFGSAGVIGAFVCFWLSVILFFIGPKGAALLLFLTAIVCGVIAIKTGAT
jgi:hypothetical protein